MQKRVERAALPSYMQEQVEKLEQAGYKVLETCQIDDTYTAGDERRGQGCEVCRPAPMDLHAFPCRRGRKAVGAGVSGH